MIFNSQSLSMHVVYRACACYTQENKLYWACVFSSTVVTVLSILSSLSIWKAVSITFFFRCQTISTHLLAERWF